MNRVKTKKGRKEVQSNKFYFKSLRMFNLYILPIGILWLPINITFPSMLLMRFTATAKDL